MLTYSLRSLLGCFSLLLLAYCFIWYQLPTYSFIDNYYTSIVIVLFNLLTLLDNITKVILLINCRNIEQVYKICDLNFEYWFFRRTTRTYKRSISLRSMCSSHNAKHNEHVIAG